MSKKVVVFMCIVGVFLAYMASTSQVNATTIKNCTDSSTLEINSSKTVCFDSDCEVVNQTETISCPYGCSSTELDCRPSPFYQNLVFIGIILLFIVAVALILHMKR